MLEISINNQNNQEKPIVIGKFIDSEACDCSGEFCHKITELIASKAVDLAVGKINKIYTFGEAKNNIVYLIGLGKKENYSNDVLRDALKGINYTLGSELNIKVDSFASNLDFNEVVKIIVERISFYNYVFDECKSEKVNNDLILNLLTDKNIEDDVNEALNIAIAISNTRDLVNKPYNYLSAIDLANYAQDLVNELNNDKVSIKIYNRKEIEKLNMGAFLGVNKGSTCEPRLIHLSYNGSDKDKVTLVGKGLMFDTGGYSIKSSMNNMKDDMSGAATSLGVFEAVVKNAAEINLDVVICATDNRINGEALLPDDVLTSMDGHTIEIISTDAEGRLTLADGITFAQKEGAKEIIDIATLTGACVVALGDYITGLFGNDEKNIEKLIKAGKYTQEDFWQLPITNVIRKQVRSTKVADLRNSTRGAGASGAAAFLEAFVKEGTKWMHLDIAGTAFHTTPTEGECYGATGATVKSLYRYLTK